MFDRIRSLLHRLHQVSEAEALTDRDLEDLGMTRAQVLDFLRMPQDITERVTAMGAIFGVPETELKRNHAQWVELLTVCGHCAERGACARVLDMGDMADPAAIDFCSNRASFLALAPHGA
ncbi:DUF6455 family protein [Tabrizicola sp. YIM 78059]|uniref:DUF6455 family protein n=1 Tax=Tabrizicola sp. YIM 78059 TaxID=2529861 RepID=UPI0010AA0D3A|nr:DUF6455 family protein [Tabrizicola sp. YIM 78059]